MRMAKQMPGTMIGSFPNLQRVMTEDNQLRRSNRSELLEGYGNERWKYQDFLVGDEILQPELVHVAGQNSYISIQ